MSSNSYRKILNVLLQNLMRMKHFEIFILKLIKKLMSRKLINQLNYNFVFSGAKGDWDFWISDLVKTPDGTVI